MLGRRLCSRLAAAAAEVTSEPTARRSAEVKPAAAQGPLAPRRRERKVPKSGASERVVEEGAVGGEGDRRPCLGGAAGGCGAAGLREEARLLA